MISITDREYHIGHLVERHTKADGKMANDMVMEFVTIGRVRKNCTRASGKMAKQMVMVYVILSSIITKFMKENGKMVNNMAVELAIMMMEVNIMLVNGKIINLTVTVFFAKWMMMEKLENI